MSFFDNDFFDFQRVPSSNFWQLLPIYVLYLDFYDVCAELHGCRSKIVANFAKVNNHTVNEFYFISPKFTKTTVYTCTNQLDNKNTFWSFTFREENILAQISNESPFRKYKIIVGTNREVFS